MNAQSSEPSWSDYYRKVENRAPRDLFIQAVELFPTPGIAIDLGCGGGIETRELLRRGWQVIAIDEEPKAFEFLTSKVPPPQRDRLTTYCSAFADLTFPSADFIWAGLSLPFCAPGLFPGVWEQMTMALRPGGRFAGDLFGVNHAWNSKTDMTFLNMEQVQGYLQSFEIELLTESEEERQTAFEGVQHWHGFAIIARKTNLP